MPIFQDLIQFVRSENAQDRYTAIEKLAKNAQSWQANLLTWQIMALIPTDREKAKLAESLHVPDIPSSEWAIISYFLLKETDDNVLSSCILTLARSQRNSLIYRVLNLFERPNLSNKLLYSLYTYAEKTGNELLAKNTIEFFSESLPSNLLSKTFFSFIKLGIINKKCKEVAFKILRETTTDDLNNSSAISALFYLGFACDKNEWEALKKLFFSIKNTELIKFFEMINSQYKILQNLNFDKNASILFLEKSLHEKHPSFIGYGAIDIDELLKSISVFIDKYSKIYPVEVTYTILKLKNKHCTKILAQDKYLGIRSIERKNNDFLAKIWAKFIPYNCDEFIQSIQNPEHFNLWENCSIDLFYLFLTSDILFDKNQVWQNFFEVSLNEQLLLCQIVAIGNKKTAETACEIFIQHEGIVLDNLKLYLNKIKRYPYYDLESFVEKVYATIIGGNTSANFLREVYKIMPFSGTSWAFTAIALCAPRLDITTLSTAIHRELEIIRQTLLNGNLEKDEYILEVTSRFQSILIGADRFELEVNQPTLVTLKEISSLIQNILDNTDNQYSHHEEFENENTDWNGHIVIDRPILRWEAILQVCLNTQLTKEELDFYEKFLCEAMRGAPHVEKRWIVRALVKLDTDDSIKSVLYQALQHIDNDFVEHSINELLRSKHRRAQQALIRAISRQNISDSIKIKIIQEIPLNNPEEVLQELKTLQMLRLSEAVDNEVQNAIVKIRQKFPLITKQKIAKETKISSLDIDFIIKSFVPLSNHLSIDSKSALRTAEMILIQSQEWGNEAVDLSPIVNMHCKAVELTMRDTFEPYTDALIRKGELSKKLENIGYGKGILDKMNAFEEHITNLPIIKNIPYFSKFKLRKMLRAICLYRPGKRFTLDGPKAFALLLLVAARKECLFELDKLMNLGFDNDTELFEFIKQVHSLQDSRNRAVHEGLTWEARDQIESMRMQAYTIICSCLKIGHFLAEFENKKYSQSMETT